MVERSLQASTDGIQKAKTALIGLSLNQQKLADRLGVTRQPISKFFNGKPIDRNLFVEICRVLNLDWQEIAHKLEAEIENDLTEASDSNIDVLVQAVRERIKPLIYERCGTMRVLDMEQPIELTGDQGIYTNVNILERLSGRRRLDIAELFENCGVEEFDRFGLNQITEEQVPGIEAVRRYKKLMVLGKPGAGKTTFLKYLAMQCIEGNFLPDHVPIFITLKDFAETDRQPELLEYINRLTPTLPVGAQGLAPPQYNNAAPIQTIIQQGRALILLDGLDEVREEDTRRILRQIRDFADHFSSNQFVITCRIAAKDYTFERFTEVEVADFNQEQIATFANNWFRAKKDRVKAERFLQKLQENAPIQELASSPLLLTLLCLMFGESTNFPVNRAELYQEGLDVLLKKWDAKRNIERDQIYKNLSLKRKEDLLSHIALKTFEQKDYFFKQKTIEAYIADFIYNLPHATDDPEVLRLDSEAILKSIEAQHGVLVERAKGIYSFSHLTFHEYFTAKKFTSISFRVSNKTLEDLATHITEKRWYEVMLLTAAMLPDADYFLSTMKHRIDSLLASDPDLQKLLLWAHQKSLSVKGEQKPAALRAFYLSFTRALDLNRIRALCRTISNTLFLSHVQNHNFDFDRTFDLELDRALDLALTLDLALNRDFAYILALNLVRTLTSHLSQSLYLPNKQLPDPEQDWQIFKNWWEKHGQTWTEQFRAAIIQHRNIGHAWQFSPKQVACLEKYFGGNKLLVDCLNSDCYISREVRQEIEETLLLPMTEIEKRERILG